MLKKKDNFISTNPVYADSNNDIEMNESNAYSQPPAPEFICNFDYYKFVFFLKKRI